MKISHKYIEPNAGICVKDISLQYDSMITAHNEYVGAGAAHLDDEMLRVYFLQSLPAAYDSLKMVIRNTNYATFESLYDGVTKMVKAAEDDQKVKPKNHGFQATHFDHGTLTASEKQTAQLLTQIRDAPDMEQAAVAFNAAYFGGRGRGQGKGKGERAEGRGKGRGGVTFHSNPCLRCGQLGHGRNACTAQPAPCSHCKGDHASNLCSQGPGGAARDTLSQGARTLLDKDQQYPVLVNVGNVLTGNAAVVLPTAAPSLAGISDVDLQAAFLARFGSVGVQNAGHYARNSGFFTRQCVAKVTFTSCLWHVPHSVWNSLMHALHGNTTMMGVYFDGVFMATSPIHFYPMMWHISHAAWNRLQHALHGNTHFFVPSVLMLLIAVCMRAYYFQSELQVAFPANSSRASVHSLFVDTGAYPAGIYRESQAFGSTLVRNVPAQIVGLFGAGTGRVGVGDVSMWVQAFHPDADTAAWRHISLAGQLHDVSATQSLYSTFSGQAAGIHHFVDQRCIILPGGWVVPFSSRKDGFYMEVVYGSALAPPPSPCALAPRLTPLQHSAYQIYCLLVGPSLALRADSVRGRGQSHVVSKKMLRMPQLSPEEDRIWKMMGCPFNKQWRWSFDATTGHGLSKPPTPVHMFTDLRVMPARMRALPFSRQHSVSKPMVIGARIQMDFQSGYPLSVPHRFSAYCTIRDHGSRWGRMIPVHQQTAKVALDCLRLFHADISALAGRMVVFIAVEADNVPFNSEEFLMGLAKWQTGAVKLTNSQAYAHQQMAYVERYHGVRTPVARILISHARCPLTWHPYAINQANVIGNKLPTSSDHAKSPEEYITGKKSDWSNMHVFGSCAIYWLPPPQRTETSKQLADRGHHAIYLGAASNVKAHHFFDLTTEKHVLSADFHIDYSRPPPGWPMSRPDDVAAVLDDLLQFPELGDCSEAFIQEMPMVSSSSPSPYTFRAPGGFAQEGDCNATPVDTSTGQIPDIQPLAASTMPSGRPAEEGVDTNLVFPSPQESSVPNVQDQIDFGLEEESSQPVTVFSDFGNDHTDDEEDGNIPDLIDPLVSAPLPTLSSHHVGGN